MCSQGTMPAGTGSRNCACGMSIEQVEARMQRGVEEERGEIGFERFSVGHKEQEERGRSRRMM